MKKCKVCDEETETVFNIKLKAVPVCDKCSRRIAQQEIEWMFDKLKGIK